MTDYLAPGVYIEEVPFNGKPIEGVDTSSGEYVNVRRYFAYLEPSIGKALQWAVFEPNDEATWSKVRSSVSDFLLQEWRNGSLQGAKPEEAFFVRCDRSTMTQDDIDGGRLICLVGIAHMKPAEFVIIRIVVQTGNADGSSSKGECN